MRVVRHNFPNERPEMVNDEKNPSRRKVKDRDKDFR